LPDSETRTSVTRVLKPWWRAVGVDPAPHVSAIPVLRDLALEPVEEARVDPALRIERGLVTVLDLLEVIDRATADDPLELSLVGLRFGTCG